MLTQDAIMPSNYSLEDVTSDFLCSLQWLSTVVPERAEAVSADFLEMFLLALGKIPEANSLHITESTDCHCSGQCICISPQWSQKSTHFQVPTHSLPLLGRDLDLSPFLFLRLHHSWPSMWPPSCIRFLYTFPCKWQMFIFIQSWQMLPFPPN